MTIISATIYGKTNCPYCDQSKLLLNNNKIKYSYILLDNDDERAAFYEKCSAELGGPVRSVPQIWVTTSTDLENTDKYIEKYVGGFHELHKFLRNYNQTISLSADF